MCVALLSVPLIDPAASVSGERERDRRKEWVTQLATSATATAAAAVSAMFWWLISEIAFSVTRLP